MDKTRTRAAMVAAGAMLLGIGQVALAGGPYTPVPTATPSIGPGLIGPAAVFGKEYSHDIDTDFIGVADPEQIIAWDGIGGTADGLDFTGTRPNWTPDQDIDATANHQDIYTAQIIDDTAHLIFSHDDMVTVHSPAAGPSPYIVPSAGPVLLSNGNLIGGAGEVSFEIAGTYAPPSTQGIWATQPMVNSAPLPIDVDGLEVWGPEPALAGDVDKYSLETDSPSTISVWNATGGGYITQATITAAVTSLLGSPSPNFPGGELQVNLDAMMVRDTTGDIDAFDRDPTGDTPGDVIIFSIQQIVDTGDASGYYATGSELFVLNGDLTASFLRHGGHLWDKAYALSDLALTIPGAGGDLFGVIDINAIEAVVDVPEPTTLALLASAGLLALRRRRSA